MSQHGFRFFRHADPVRRPFRYDRGERCQSELHHRVLDRCRGTFPARWQCFDTFEQVFLSDLLPIDLSISAISTAHQVSKQIT